MVLNPSELVLNPSESVLVVPLRSAQEEYGQLAPDGEPAQVEDEVDKVHAETQHNTLRWFRGVNRQCELEKEMSLAKTSLNAAN